MARNKQEIDIDGRRVALTNLDKVLFPSGFTKGQVIDFYTRVSDYLLPHLRGRPITLKRCPTGIDGCFYEKEAPRYRPDWMRTFDVPRREKGVIHYVVLDDLPSLVWAANAANLEMHPFLHQVPEIDQPTAVVFDLDPGEGAGILNCARVAFLVKDALAEAGLEAWPKVSGSKGIQIYAPLNTPVTYAETKPFAKRLAERVEAEHSDLVVSEMAKAKRVNKVLIDWSQNADFKTTVSVYSLRATPDGPHVSMPVTWDELEHAIGRRNSASLYWAPDAALKRLAKAGDLFQPVLTQQQRLRALTLSAA
jgi:bifunctional non-homologous end joining protein LigD